MESLLEVGLQIPLDMQVEWYRQTMLNTYHEVHALQLGVYSGILVLALRTRGYRHLSTVLTLALFAFTMGFPDIYAVCHRSGEYCGSLPVQLQPWYFLTGLLAVAIVAPQVASQLRRAWRWSRSYSSYGSVPGRERPSHELAADGGRASVAVQIDDAHDETVDGAR